MKTKILRLEVRLLWQARRLKKIHFGDPDKNLYDLGRIFLIQLQKDDILERAGSMAFSYTLALFPMILFLLNLIPYLQDIFPYITTQKILTFIQEILPEEIYTQSKGTIMDIVSRPRQSLLSLGFFFSLFASTQGVVSMMNSFNSVYQTKDNRGFFQSRGIAVSIVFTLALTVITASLVMILGEIVIRRLDEMQVFNSGFMIFLFTSLKFLILLFMFYITTAFIFRFAPAVHDKWKFFSAGAKLAGLLTTLGFYGFTFYLNNFASYNRLYGSIGTLIALMLWLLITSIIILVCFEVNVSLDLVEENKKRKRNTDVEDLLEKERKILAK
ncbi:YihY/virulence factor BrkB family protein [Algoriphagus sp. D3-2-R+10]|uniref:YihY/virulence factor BrkB family protein n=1 Tax=Algoriphagus aurantiacus TaxID=3103948 RepID=UPI002B37D3B8|nr:YihY/virulence factor BrkB family protein [Algoriphagus sp. D3-2-R+10]MEB2776480.1 YihY/virulence factor BrkB family protein [Algoriphagus sp. D3-2-R+10]